MKTTKTKYVEDILQQDEFTAEELMGASHKHPINHWVTFQWFMLTDTIELRVAKFKGQLKRFLKHFTTTSNK